MTQISFADSIWDE